MGEQTVKRKSYYKPRPKQQREKIVTKGVAFTESVYTEILTLSESKSFSKTVVMLIKESLENRKKELLQAEN